MFPDLLLLSSLSSIPIVKITITSSITIKYALGIVKNAIAECLFFACLPYACLVRFNYQISIRSYLKALMYCLYCFLIESQSDSDMVAPISCSFSFNYFELLRFDMLVQKMVRSSNIFDPFMVHVWMTTIFHMLDNLKLFHP